MISAPNQWTNRGWLSPEVIYRNYGTFPQEFIS